MKVIGLIVFNLVVLVTPILASAQIRLPSYNQLCEYESDCGKVGKVKGRQLIVMRPRPVLMEYYSHFRKTIISIATQYQIDAVTLVMAPLAENTMNVHIDDKLQDALVNMGAAPEGEIAGKPMSIGPGQIYTYAAKHVEKLAAAIEHRPLRNKREITSQLMTPEGALRYAAAIIRDAQDTYGAAGIDISKRPEILSTLYNIGQIKERLANSRGREPYPNYFGYFVGLNYDYVRDTLHLPSVIPAATPQ